MRIIIDAITDKSVIEIKTWRSEAFKDTILLTRFLQQEELLAEYALQEGKSLRYIFKELPPAYVIEMMKLVAQMYGVELKVEQG